MSGEGLVCYLACVCTDSWVEAVDWALATDRLTEKERKKRVSKALGQPGTGIREGGRFDAPLPLSLSQCTENRQIRSMRPGYERRERKRKRETHKHTDRQTDSGDGCKRQLVLCYRGHKNDTYKLTMGHKNQKPENAKGQFALCLFYSWSHIILHMGH